MTRPAQKSSADRFAIFKEHLRHQGLKSTSQRDDIARVFFATKRHINVEELYNEVKQINPRIGYATVYRTMKLLTECGLAVERHFRDGEARYESLAEGCHHDHFICEGCGKIVEFTEHRIEALQSEVARRLGFRFTGHKMELYGLCRDCQQHSRRAGDRPPA
ncbi:MAG: Fur family transcriptional regulator [Candidatus Binatia bacterium]